MSQSKVVEKLEQLKAYIPFVDKMINKLESPNHHDKAEHLEKLKGLYKFLTNPDSRRQNIEMLDRMEKIIKVMYKSMGKGSSSSTSHSKPAEDSRHLEREKREDSKLTSSQRIHDRRDERSRESSRDERTSYRDHSKNRDGKDGRITSREQEHRPSHSEERHRSSKDKDKYRSGSREEHRSVSRETELKAKAKETTHNIIKSFEKRDEGRSSHSKGLDNSYLKARERQLFGDDSDPGSLKNIAPNSSPSTSPKESRNKNAKHSLLDLPMPPMAGSTSFTSNSKPFLDSPNLKSSLSSTHGGEPRTKFTPSDPNFSGHGFSGSKSLNNADLKRRIGLGGTENVPKPKYNFHELKFSEASLGDLNINEKEILPLFPAYKTDSLKDSLSNSVKESLNKETFREGSSESLKEFSPFDKSRPRPIQKSPIRRSSSETQIPFSHKDQPPSISSSFHSSQMVSTSKNLVSSLKPTDIPLPTYPNVDMKVKTPDSDSPDNEPTFSPPQPDDVTPKASLEKDSIPNIPPVAQVNMEAIQKALNFINAHEKKTEVSNVSYRYEDFVGPATSSSTASSSSDYYNPEEAWKTPTKETFGNKDMDFRNRPKEDVDLRQIPGQFLPRPPPTSPLFQLAGDRSPALNRGSTNTKFSPLHTNEFSSLGTNSANHNWYQPSESRRPIGVQAKDAKDVDMRTLPSNSQHGSSLNSNSRPPKVPLSSSVCTEELSSPRSEESKGVTKKTDGSKMDVIRSRVSHDQDKLIKLGQKGVAASQLETYKQKRDKMFPSTNKSISPKGSSASGSEIISNVPSIPKANSLSVLDTLLPESKGTVEDENLSSLDTSLGKSKSLGFSKPIEKEVTSKTKKTLLPTPIEKESFLNTNSLSKSKFNNEDLKNESSKHDSTLSTSRPQPPFLPPTHNKVLLPLPSRDSNASHLSRNVPISLESKIPVDPRNDRSLKDPRCVRSDDVPRDPRSSTTSRISRTETLPRDVMLDAFPRDPRSEKVPPVKSRFDQLLRDPRSESFGRDPRSEKIIPREHRPDGPILKDQRHLGVGVLPVRRDPRLNIPEPHSKRDLPRDPRTSSHSHSLPPRDPRIGSSRDNSLTHCQPHPPPQFNRDARWNQMPNITRPPFPHPPLNQGVSPPIPVAPVPPTPQFQPTTSLKNSAIGQTFTCLIMQGLPHYANSSHIYKFFEEYLLRDICIELDQSYNCKGTAYIHFPNHLSAREALEKENGRFIQGYKIYLRICSVGILRQAKLTNELQNFDREKYLNIPPRPRGNGNPFYNPKPKAPPPVHVDNQTNPPSVATGDQTDVKESTKEEEPLKPGYSSLCGVKMTTQGTKSLQSFKIPKLKKGSAEELSSEVGDSHSKVSVQKENSKITKGIKSLDISQSSESDSEDVKKFLPQTKKNRRYRKIIKAIESDSESEKETSKSKKVSLKSSVKPKSQRISLDSLDSDDNSMVIDESAMVSSSNDTDVSDRELPSSPGNKEKIFDNLFQPSEKEKAPVTSPSREKKTKARGRKPIKNKEVKVGSVRGRKKGSKKKVDIIDSDIRETKITRQKHVEFKEILSPKKKLPVRIPIPAKLVYCLMIEDKVTKRGPRRSKIHAAASTPESFSSSLSAATTSEPQSSNSLSVSQESSDNCSSSSLKTNTTFSLPILTDSEVSIKLGGDAVSSASDPSFKSKKRQIPVTVVRRAKRCKRIRNKWQKGYKKSGSPLPEPQIIRLNRKRSYSPPLPNENLRSKSIKLDIPVPTATISDTQSCIYSKTMFDDDIIGDVESPDLTQITPSITDKEMSIFNALPELSSIEGVIGSGLVDVNSKAGDKHLTPPHISEESKAERIKLISEDLVQTANKFTQKETQQHQQEAQKELSTNKTLAHGNDSEKRVLGSDEEEEDTLSIKVNQLVASLDDSIPTVQDGSFVQKNMLESNSDHSKLFDISELPQEKVTSIESKKEEIGQANSKLLEHESVTELTTAQSLEEEAMTDDSQKESTSVIAKSEDHPSVQDSRISNLSDCSGKVAVSVKSNESVSSAIEIDDKVQFEIDKNIDQRKTNDRYQLNVDNTNAENFIGAIHSESKDSKCMAEFSSPSDTVSPICDSSEANSITNDSMLVDSAEVEHTPILSKASVAQEITQSSEVVATSSCSGEDSSSNELAKENLVKIKDPTTMEQFQSIMEPEKSASLLVSCAEEKSISDSLLLCAKEKPMLASPSACVEENLTSTSLVPCAEERSVSASISSSVEEDSVPTSLVPCTEENPTSTSPVPCSDEEQGGEIFSENEPSMKDQDICSQKVPSTNELVPAPQGADLLSLDVMSSPKNLETEGPLESHSTPTDLPENSLSSVENKTDKTSDDALPNSVADVAVESDAEDGLFSIPDDNSVVSSEGREISTPDSTIVGSGRRSKREKSNPLSGLIESRRITRGSLVIPEVNENILWDDGGTIDLFLCDQCDYGGKQRVSHLVNFHSEREVPCEFRKEDFYPVLRDSLGPQYPFPPEKKVDLGLSTWIPQKMTFDEEIDCQVDGCDYYSSNRFDFVYHLLDHNPEAVPGIFHCRLCNFMSDILTQFYDHVASHTGEYRHTCDRCGQRAFSIDALVLHHTDYHGSQSQEFSSKDMVLEDGWPYIYVCRTCHYVQITKENMEKHIKQRHHGRVDFIKANMTRTINIHADKRKEGEALVGTKQEAQEISVTKGSTKVAVKKPARGGKAPKRLKAKRKAKARIVTKPKAGEEKETKQETEVINEKLEVVVKEEQKEDPNVPVFLGHGNVDESVKKPGDDKHVEELVNRILLNNYTTRSSFEIKKKISTLDTILKKVDDSKDGKETTSHPGCSPLHSENLIDHMKVDNKLDAGIKTPEIQVNPKEKHDLKNSVDNSSNSLEDVNISSSSMDTRDEVEMPIVQQDLTSKIPKPKGKESCPVSKNGKDLGEAPAHDIPCAQFPIKEEKDEPLLGIISRLKATLAEDDLMAKIKEKEDLRRAASTKDAPLIILDEDEDSHQVKSTVEDSDSDGNLVICEDENSVEPSSSEGIVATPGIIKPKLGLKVKPPHELFAEHQDVSVSKSSTSVKCRMRDCSYTGSSMNEIGAHSWASHRIYMCIFPNCSFVSVSDKLYDPHFVQAHKIRRFECPMRCPKSTMMVPSEMMKHVADEHLTMIGKTKSAPPLLPTLSSTEPDIQEPEDNMNFLRIESYGTLDPKSASQIFNSEENRGKEDYTSPSPVFNIPPESAVVKKKEEFFPMIEPEEGQNSSFTTFQPKKEEPTPFPGSETLPVRPPTVPLIQLFLEFQLHRSFVIFTGSRASEVFKCMVLGCTFATDDRLAFERHSDSHQMKEFRCCYCLLKLLSSRVLVEHILSEHSHCLFQCKYCLYRAYTKVYLGVHLRKFHPEKEPRYIKVGTIKQEPPPNPAIENFVHPYKCTYGQCNFRSVDTDAFKAHTATHGLNVRMQCIFCEVVFDVEGLLTHMKGHMMNEYQCPYCLYGEAEREKLLTHLLNCHPGRPGKVLLRRQVSNNAPMRQSPAPVPPPTGAAPIVATTGVPVTPVTSVATTSVPVSSTTNVLSGSCVPTTLSASSHLSSVKSTSGMISPSTVTATTTTATVTVSVAPVSVLTSGNHQKGVPTSKASSSVWNPTPITSRINESSSALDQTGLTGDLLYRCGNEKCEYSCRTQLLLKEHLQVCDFSRDSPLLRCFHCSKNFRHLSGLLDHIKVHGPKRYLCGVEGCDYRGTLPHYFKNHMKQIHQNTGYKIVLKDFANKNPETQEFIVYPKEVVTSLKEPHKKRRNEYGVDDEEKIPHPHVSYQELKCYHCMYSTKIRLNLVKHLNLHKKYPNGIPPTDNLQDIQKTIPSKQPVNPVPRLERNELMFDKMMNLAGSSFEDKRKREENELRVKYPIPQEELDALPGIVPEEKLYSCGIDGCNYSSCDEVMLKYHIKTLHSEVEAFQCPHCSYAAISMDKMGAHFKLHGDTLYRCGWCTFLTPRKALIERHLKENHASKPQFDFCIRGSDMDKEDELKDDIKQKGPGVPKRPSEVASLTQLLDNEEMNPHEKLVEGSNSGGQGVGAASQEPLWQCGSCPFRSVIQNEMVNHTNLKHGIKSQYQCGFCNVRSSVRTAFDTHFAAKHPDKAFRVLCMYYRVDSDDIEPLPPGGSTTSHEPLWRRNDPDRKRQIRGILLEDDHDETDPSLLSIQPGNPKGDEFVCPKCHSFKTPCISTFRSHLCKEANYQRFECAECGITNPLLPTLRRHYTKTHGSQFSSDCYINLPTEPDLEVWVESIISHQQQLIKVWRESGGTPVSPTKSSSKKASNLSEYDSGSVQFPGSSGVVIHESGSEKGRYICNICGVECRTGSGLKSHTTAMHQTKYKCQYCPFSSNTELAIRHHRSLKHPKYENQEGNNNASKPSAISSPSQSSGEGTEDLVPEKAHYKFECSHCEFKTNSSRSFYSHCQKLHANLRVFLCEYCGKRFESERDGNRHSRWKHPGKMSKVIYSPTEDSAVTKEGLAEEQSVNASKPGTTTQPELASKIGETSTLTSTVKKPLSICYSCCHCSLKGPYAFIEEHLKAQHRDLPFLVRKEEERNLYLEVYKYRCGHCSMDSVSLMEAMDHWVNNHVTLNFNFSLALFTSSVIRADPTSTPSSQGDTEEEIASESSSLSSTGDMIKLPSPISKTRRSVTTTKPDSSIPSDLEEPLDDGIDSSLDVLDGGTTDSEIESNQVSSSTSEKDNETLAKCGYCRKTSKLKSDIYNHIRSAHKDKPQKITVLPRSDYDRLYKGKFECMFCGEQGTIAEMTQHNLTVHPGVSPNLKRVIRSQLKNKVCFRCEICAHVVKTRKSINHHMSKMHPTETSSFKILQFESNLRVPTKQPIKCKYCGDTAATVKEMESHHTFLHSHLPASFINLRDEALSSIHKPSSSSKPVKDSSTSSFSIPSPPVPLQLPAVVTKDNSELGEKKYSVKNTARKSFPISFPTKRQIATKSTSGRLQLVRMKELLHDESEEEPDDEEEENAEQRGEYMSPASSPEKKDHELYASVNLLGSAPMRLSVLQLSKLINLNPVVVIENSIDSKESTMRSNM